MSDDLTHELNQKLDNLIKKISNPLRQLVIIFSLISCILGANVTSDHIENVVAGNTNLSYNIILAAVFWVVTFILILVFIFKQGLNANL